MTSTQQRKSPDDRVSEILRHARRELAEHGHEGFVPGRVAERCGVSEATIYRYFPTKRDLLVRVAEEWFAEILGALPPLARQPDVYDQLRVVVRHSLEIIHKAPALTRFVLVEIRQGRENRSKKIHELNRRYVSNVMNVIQRGIDEGSVRPDVPTVLVRDLVFGCIEHRAWAYLRGQRDFSVEETADTIASTVFYGLALAPIRERERVESALARVEEKTASLNAEVDALRDAVKKRPRKS